MLAEDETHINLLPWVRAIWIARGRRTQVITPGKNHRRTIFGAMELATGRWCYHICRKAVSATFTAFCEQLLATSPTLTIQGRVRQVHAFFRARSPTQILTTAAPHSSPWLPEGHMQNVRQAA